MLSELNASAPNFLAKTQDGIIFDTLHETMHFAERVRVLCHERAQEKDEDDEDDEEEEEEEDDLPEVAALKRLTVVKLKELLTARGLGIAGRKDDLI